MWLSLIRTASSSPKRWLWPPPQRTAYFSRPRSPGVVFLVQTMCAPCGSTSLCMSRVAMAMPQSLPNRLSAVRSAERIERAGPRTVASTVPASTSSPSEAMGSISIVGSSSRKAERETSNPATRPAARGTTWGAGIWGGGGVVGLGHLVGGQDGVAREVPGAAEILLQGPADQGLVEEGVELRKMDGRRVLT